MKKYSLSIFLSTIICVFTLSNAAQNDGDLQILYLPILEGERQGIACSIEYCAARVISTDGQVLETYETDMLSDPTNIDTSYDDTYLISGSLIINLETGWFFDLETAQTGGQHAWATWSPVENRIAYTIFLDGASNTLEHQLFFADLQGDTVVSVDDLYIFGNPSWSPDGESVVVGAVPTDAEENQFSLYMIDAHDGSYQPLYEFDEQTLPYADWSPDGEAVVFSSAVAQDETNQLLLLDVGSGDTMPITIGGEQKWMAQWSPDDTSIAFYQTNGDAASIQLLDVDTRETVELANKPAIGSLSWSPDGSQIAFVGGEVEQSDVCIVTVDTREERCLGVQAHWLSNILWLKR